LATRRLNTKKGEQATIEEWLRKHTVQDMEDIVTELSVRGEDVSDMSKVVHELEDIAEEEHEWEREHGTKLKAEGETA
jgi:hypothetical protein